MCNPDVYQRDLNDLAAQFKKVGSVCLRGKLLIKKLKINKFMQKVGKKLQGCMHDNFIKVYIKNMSISRYLPQGGCKPRNRPDNPGPPWNIPGTTPWNGVESKNKKNEILTNQNNYKTIVSLSTFKTSPLLML